MRVTLMSQMMTTTSRQSVRSVWIGICLGLCACGGGSEQAAPPPQAAPTQAVENPTEAAAKPVVADEATTKFAALTKELEERSTDKPLDGAWLEQQLKAVLAANPRHSAARFNLAVLYALKGDKAQAKAAYEAILKDEPKFVPAIENLAAMSVAQGDVPAASATYKQIVKADPKNQTSRLALARILQTQGQHQEAIDLCRQVLQRKADEIEAFRILAESYRALGDIPMAELIIGRGLKVNKDDSSLHYLTAQILLDKGDLPGGVRTLKEVIRLKPEWLTPRARLAEIALTYRDFGTSTQQYEQIHKLLPEDRSAKLGLAVSYKGLGRYDQAEKLYNELLAKDPKDFDVLWNMAVLFHLNTSEFDKATEFYKRAKSVAPAGDKQAESIDQRVQTVAKLKADDTARKARQERERKKQEGIAAACAAIANGQPANGEAIGGEQDRIQAAWDLLLVTAVGKIQAGDVTGGEASAKCALGIVPTTPGAGAVACGQLRVNWIQIQDQAGMLTSVEAMRNALSVIEEAVKCDPENPDPQLFKQQLEQMIVQQQEAGQAAPADGAVPSSEAPAELPTSP